MKQGRTLTEIAQELTRQLESKRDFKAPTAKIAYTPEGPGVHLNLEGIGTPFTLNKIAHDQVAEYTGIPARYYDILRQKAPALLATNVNHWLQEKNEVRLVRTLDGTARAFLSHRYRAIDNYDVAEAVLPILQENEVRVVSSEVTETRMYIRAVCERLQTEVRQGDVVQAGVVISNSEVGLGAVKVEPLVYRLICLNGAILPDAGLRRYHIGRNGQGDLEEAVEVYQDDTMRADAKAFFLKLRDVVRSAFNEARFRQLAEAVSAGTKRAISGDVAGVVEDVTAHYRLPGEASGNILRHLVNGGDLSQWGLVNAITAYSKDVEFYEQATELERIGGDLALLDDQAWQKLLVNPN